ncbi:MAG TPA: hypothetical protein VMS92_03335 [Mycobacterium sp.]|nr:hypothetical protein [Mycobacterium sp.]
MHHRLSRAGDRQLNLCLHVMALTQIRQDTSGRAYYLRKRSEGKGHKEACAASNDGYPTSSTDNSATTQTTDRSRPGRTLGGGSIVQRGQLKPRN